MNPVSIVLLALAMSADAFAAAVSKGTAIQHPRWSEALRTGLIFGGIEALTPLVGWALGVTFARYVEAWDHWVAFVLLAGLGVRMLSAGLRAPQAVAPDKPERHSFWLLAATGFATSVDAMAAGVGLALLDINIVPVAATIGCTTFVMASLGVKVGHALGAAVGQRAEIVGGLLLIGIGATILVEHLYLQGG